MSTECKILSYILLSSLTPYAEKIIGGGGAHDCESGLNSSTTDRIFSFLQILEKKMGIK